MTAKPMTRASAERLTTVLSTVVDMVEASDTHPNAAIAKAASDHGLPVQHVPMAVRAYNNGRAARQLAESTDPWVRAASYPTATVDGVLRELTGSSEKSAGDLTDYQVPRVKETPPVDLAKFAAMLGVPVTEKRASVAAPSNKVANWSKVMSETATTWVKLASFLRETTPEVRAAVRCVGSTQASQATQFVFERLGERYTKESAVPDPTFPADHPALTHLRDMERLHQTPSVGGPKRTASVKTSNGLALAYCEDKEAGFRDAIPKFFPTLIPGSSSNAISPLGRIRATMDRGIGKVDDARAAGGDALRSTALALRYQLPTARGLASDLQGLDSQETINGLLQDPRLRTADPAAVVSTYQTLASLAPTVMSNHAVAGEFVHRTMQTGPLSYHDLASLTKMEKDVVDSRRARQEQ